MANMRSTSMHCIYFLSLPPAFGPFFEVRSRAGNLCTNHLTWVSVSLCVYAIWSRQWEYASWNVQPVWMCSQIAFSIEVGVSRTRGTFIYHESYAVCTTGMWLNFSRLSLSGVFFAVLVMRAAATAALLLLYRKPTKSSRVQEKMSAEQKKNVCTVTFLRRRIWHLHGNKYSDNGNGNICERNQIAEKIRSLYVCTENGVMHEVDDERWSACGVCVCALIWLLVACIEIAEMLSSWQHFDRRPTADALNTFFHIESTCRCATVIVALFLS